MGNLGKALVGGLIAVNLALLGLLYFRDRSVEPARAETLMPATAPARPASAEPGSPTTELVTAPELAPEPAVDPVTDPEPAVKPAPAPRAPATKSRKTERAPAPAPAPRETRSGAPREETRSASRSTAEVALPSDTWPRESSSSGAGETWPASKGQEPAPRASERAAAPAPRTEPAPQRISVSVPAGAHLAAELDVAVHSREVREGDRFEASLADPLVVNGRTVAPAGSAVTGRVVEVVLAGKVKGREQLKLTLDSIDIAGKRYPLDASTLALEAEGDGGRDAATVGGAAAAGAVLGAILGGGDGAAKGAAVGAAAGTGIVVSTRGRAIHLKTGSRLDFTLESALRVTLPPASAPPPADDAPQDDQRPADDRGDIARR